MLLRILHPILAPRWITTRLKSEVNILLLVRVEAHLLLDQDLLLHPLDRLLLDHYLPLGRAVDLLLDDNRSWLLNHDLLLDQDRNLFLHSLDRGSDALLWPTKHREKQDRQ